MGMFPRASFSMLTGGERRTHRECRGSVSRRALCVRERISTNCSLRPQGMPVPDSLYQLVIYSLAEGVTLTRQCPRWQRVRHDAFIGEAGGDAACAIFALSPALGLSAGSWAPSEYNAPGDLREGPRPVAASPPDARTWECAATGPSTEVVIVGGGPTGMMLAA